jgi:hypothetical protein
MCLYFAINRGAALFTGEVAQRWGVKPHLISDRLEAARKNGLLVINKMPGEQQQFYSEGPTLKRLIEEGTL